MSWPSRLLNVLRRNRLAADLDDEIQFHLASRMEELKRRGMTPSDAEAEVRRRFGNSLLVREASRDIKLFPHLESILQDAQFGLRLFRKNAVVSAVAVLSLSLAIGSCTAAFSLISALILRPLPVKDPDKLVYLAFRAPGATTDSTSFNYPLFEQMRAASRAQVQLFGMSYQGMREAAFDDSGGETERVYGQWVSGDTFTMLGVKPALGRLLENSDDLRPGQHPVAVLSYDFWTRRFGRSPSVLGRWVTIRDKHLQIVGVAERGFTGGEPGIMTDLWAPNMMWGDNALSESAWSWFLIWGRLQPGVTLDQAQQVLQPVFSNFRRELASAARADEPRERIDWLINTRLYLRSAANGPSSLRLDFLRPLWTLATIAALVLLIASFNVASLQLARAAARSREMALRMSVGAGRGRLIRQLLIESALLSIAACTLGALLAAQASPLIVRMLSTSQSLVRLDVQLDWRVLAFLAAAGSLTTLLFGLTPALRASAVSPNDVLKSGGAKHTTTLGLLRPLVAGQTAFGFVVLFIAGLFLVTFARLIRTEIGFDAANLAVAEVEAKGLSKGGSKELAAWSQLLDRLRDAPGVESASLSGWSLFEGSSQTLRVRVPGRAPEAFEGSHFLPVSPRFLNTMRIRRLEGRDLEWRDAEAESPSSVVVNESFARRYFPAGPALGKRFFRVHGSTLVAQEIVGIAGDAKYNSLRQPAPPTVYYSHRPAGWAAVQMRTRLEPSAVAALLRTELPRVHPAFRLTNVTLQSTLVDNRLVRERLLALLSGFFSIVAVALVCLGLYGVLSYSVVQRTREIGIRLALGHRPIGVVALILSEIALVMAIGLVVGLGAGIAASRSIASLLYEVKPSDPASIAVPLVCMILACALSALVPALRATRVDPVTALRYE